VRKSSILVEVVISIAILFLAVAVSVNISIFINKELQKEEKLQKKFIEIMNIKEFLGLQKGLCTQEMEIGFTLNGKEYKSRCEEITQKLVYSELGTKRVSLFKIRVMSNKEELLSFFKSVVENAR